MAGGSSSPEGLESTMLEMPTYILTLILLFFLVVSVAFDRVVIWLRHYFQKKGRQGLAEAVEKVTMELTTLGFVSLILLLFQNQIIQICVPYSNTASQWTILESIGGCPCCLSQTGGVTVCAQIAHGCYFDKTDTNLIPYCGCDDGGGDGYSYDANITCSLYEDAEGAFIIDQSLAGIARLAHDLHISEVQVTQAIQAGFEELNNGSESQPPSDGYNNDPDLDEFFYDIGSVKNRLLLFDSDDDKKKNPYKYHHHHTTQSQPSTTTTTLKKKARRQLKADSSSSSSTTKFSQLETNGEVVNGAIARSHILPKLTRFTCTGPFLSGACQPGYFPAATPKSLLQVHLFIFCVAIFHVATTVFVILGTNAQLLIWTWWQKKHISAQQNNNNGSIDGGDSRSKSMRTMTSRSLTLDGRVSSLMEGQHSMQSVGSLKKGDDVDTTSTQLEDKKDSSIDNDDSENSGGKQEQQHNNNNNNNDSTAAAAVNTTITTITTATSSSQQQQQTTSTTTPRPSFFLQTQKLLHRRDTFIKRRSHWFLEVLIWLGNAFIPIIISREEFLRMREAYLREYDLPYSYDFIKDIQQHLDFDLVQLVGVTVDMWIVFILMFLFLGIQTWVAGLVYLLGFVAMYIVNVVLCAMVRYAARGQSSTPKTISQPTHRRFYKNPKNLAYPIRMIIFIFSLAFSSVTFFAWQFGSNSCILTLDMLIYMPVAVPYYVAIIIVLVLVLWVSLVTIPAWTCTMHLHGNEHHHNEHDDALRTPMAKEKDSSPENGWTNEELSREIARLMMLQRRVGGRMSIQSPRASSGS